MIYDGQIDIATGFSSTCKVWKNKSILWSELVERLNAVVRTGETYNQYMSAPKDEQNKIKDVGGYVGGKLKNGRRHAENVEHRQLIALDIDFAHDNFWWDFTMIYGCAAVLHSTHKHKPTSPRYRLIIPISRPVSTEEYEAIARKVAGDMNIELFDSTTFQVHRLMYWPSASVDADYFFEAQDGEWLDADSILATYADWTDAAEWPKAEAQEEIIKHTIGKQEDPNEKSGIVGVFCRTYGIKAAIAAFLNEIYLETTEDRYSYAKGTTAGGLIIYDDKFVYSHHSTDPCGGRLCNSFDMVRIHKFGHLDKSKDKQDAQLPSYRAMEEFAAKDPSTRRAIAAEKFAEAKFEFQNLDENDDTAIDTAWTSELEANRNGVYENSANNINIILQKDGMLKEAFKLNTFDNKRYVTKSLPWRKIPEPEPLRDVDYSGIRNYTESVYGIVASSKIDDSLALEFEKKSYHPIKDYVRAQTWDGIPRVETLLIDYFGAEDSAFTRAAIKKTLVGAIARIFNPGIKFDLVLTLVGDQGTGKSTFVKKLGKQWFSDTFTTVQGKESFEQIQGAWIIEIAELSGLRKAEVETIKQFISKCEDMFRPAYGRVIETYKRQCVFFGTTNNKDFLRDPTGNRRFMPIAINFPNATKCVFTGLNESDIDNIWAEAYKMYLAGEKLFLSTDEEKLAKVEQSKHSEIDERRGIIEEYLNRLLPKDWASFDLHKRRDWLNDPIHIKGEETRDYVCIAEIWCECLHKEKTDMSRYNTREINEILKSLTDWEFINSTKNFSMYGKQKYYARKID